MEHTNHIETTSQRLNEIRPLASTRHRDRYPSHDMLPVTRRPAVQ